MSFDTPVVLILFNRPKRVRELIDELRCVRPTRILVVADGPRDGYASDRDACAGARAEVDNIDWPSTIEREFASTNLGCDRRVASGLDWAFSRVDRAIVLEDDILPNPSFFPWANSMLDRFGDDPSVAVVSGRNPLGRWAASGGYNDHVRARRGSIWGWAATACAWRRTAACVLSGDPARALDDAAETGADPLLAGHYGLALRAYRCGVLDSWDVIFELQNFLLGGAAIVSPVNLVRNTGFGPGATHSLFADDLRALTPVGTTSESRANTCPRFVQGFDAGFDRAALLVDLMSLCKDPPMAYRLATCLGRNKQLPLDDVTRHHLLPFAVPGESLALIEHLTAQGVASRHFDLLRQTLREGTSARAGTM